MNSPKHWLQALAISFFTLSLAAAGCGDGGDIVTPDAAPDSRPPEAGTGEGGMDVPPTLGAVRVTAPTTVITSEQGGQANFALSLDSPPTAAVTVAISSSKPAEGTVAPATVTFTPSNWSAHQVITITGVDDQVKDGNVVYTIVLAPATSADARFSGADAADVMVTNLDDESAGILVTGDNLRTFETGGEDTFTVALTSRPMANVTIPLTSSDAGEGTVSPASLVFTPSNWDAPQTVTVTGVDDAAADGAATYQVTLGAAVSDDPGYHGLDGRDVTVFNVDNDSPGITVDVASLLMTSEAGGQGTFTVVLNSRPGDDVVIDLASSDPGEGVPTPARLTFTDVNWNAPQTVTVTGVDDDLADGSQVYMISATAVTSADPGYNGQTVSVVSARNTDNDSAGVVVSAPALVSVNESGSQASFSVVLTSAPAANVALQVTSGDVEEGTVSPALLTFTPLNWSAPQTVTLTGVGDAIADGNQRYTILLGVTESTDPAYAGIDVLDVMAETVDDDSAGVTVSPVSGLITTEIGGQAAFTVVLNAQPIGNVIIPLSLSDTTEGSLSVTGLTFTPVNWNAPQTVTITGVDDNLADGNQLYEVITGMATSVDAAYAAVDPANVSVSNTDNDTSGITVTSLPGLATSEGGGQGTFTVVLNTQPTANVSIAVSSSDVGEGIVSPATLTFTPLNWSAPQVVTVTGVDDAVADGNQPYNVVLAAATSTDTTYGGVDPADVAVSNTDNDSPGFTVVPVSGLTTGENGQQTTFTIRLNSQPTADVVIALSSSDVGEATVLPASVTFTPVNWSAPKILTLTGINDDLADGNQPFTIVTAPVVTTDSSGYAGMDPPNVTGTNTDNDTAGITVSAISRNTTEAMVDATFTVVLNSQPTADVVIALTSSDLSEGTVSPASLTFTAMNWNAPQTVTALGVNDNLADGNQPYTIVTAAAVSMDTTGYSGMNAADVAVTNTDNDSAGISVSLISGNTTEAGGTATFTIVLNSQPTADVVIPLSSSDTSEGTVSSMVTFTTLNWSAPQTVTVTGIDDALDDNDQMYSIITGPATSGDTTGYSGMNPADVMVTNTDNDSAGFTITNPGGLSVTEAGGAGNTDTFTVVLNSEPNGSVVIGLSSMDATEANVSPAMLTFNAGNWNVAQTVTVTGVNDGDRDNDQPFTIVTDMATGSDTTGYVGMDPANVTGTNVDDDVEDILVSTTGPITTTEAGAGTATFTVSLTVAPTADVVIPLMSTNTNEGTVPASITFTVANWNTPQTVTVTGVDDAIDDDNQPYIIVLGASMSADTDYNGIDPPNVSASNTDNDSFGITVSNLAGVTVTEAAGAGHTATFTIVLDSQPTANVTIGITSSLAGQATVAPASVTFTAGDWNMAQTVTVTAVDDAIDDGDSMLSITTAAATSTDPHYSGLAVSDVPVNVTDDDMWGFTVSAISGNTKEDGTTATFTVVLTSQPTADVTIGLSSSNTAEGTVAPASLTFTAMDWSMAQTVTVTGVDDMPDAVDGAVMYTIVTAAATSADGNYSGKDPGDVSVTNDDDDMVIMAPEVRMYSVGLRTGNVGGRAGADADCTANAPAWAMGKTIHAFMSFDANDEIRDMPALYGMPTTSPFRDITGANTVADDLADLLDGSLDMSFNAAGISTTYFWTFTLGDGSLAPNHCAGGTSTAGGMTGRVNGYTETNANWMGFYTGACSLNNLVNLVCAAW